MLQKRKGDDNIGKLIIFALTILIAVGLLTLIGYFFSQNMEKTKVTAILAGATQSASDLTSVGILTTVNEMDTVTSSFNVLSEVHTIVVDADAAGDLDTLDEAKIANNTKSYNVDSSVSDQLTITYSL